jgi:dynein heavy chain
MYSIEEEKVDFVRVIDTVLAEGAVERWLVEVEDCMLKSVREMILEAMIDYPKHPRHEWVLPHKGQAVLAVSMIFWCQMTEKAMAESGLAGIKAFLAICNDLLFKVVELVRSPLTELGRCTLKALIVLDVHSRDVIDQLLREGIEEKTDFSWMKQLRYYWENDDVIVRMINADLDYNYEYLGNSERLVITKLTDQCYITLCGAVQLNYGGAPEGPAGTGKTETVKDLAKALARQCVVFNCSDGLDEVAMGKFFKGLASAGAWSCFDEFNRIDPEVLSVIAQ